MGDANVESKMAAPLGASVLAIILSVTFIGLRLFTRGHTKQSLWVDDYLAITSFWIILGTAVTIAIMTRYGLGNHLSVLSDDTILLYRRTQFVVTVLYTVGLFTIKMTFLFQYLRILGDAWRTYRKFMVATLLIGLWAMSEFWVNVFRCAPIQGAWDSSIPSMCIPNGPYQYVYIAGDIISAIAVVLFPVMFMRQVTIGWAEAAVLAAVYSLGLFVVVLQFVRLHFVDLGDDFTWTFADRASLMITELSIALLCICAPLLHPLAEHFLPQWFHTFDFEKEETKDVSQFWPRDMEQTQKKRRTFSLGKTGVSGNGFDADLDFETEPRQKNINHTPREGLDDLPPLTRRDNSGDLSDEVIGLSSARRGMNRTSFIRGMSEADFRKLGPKLSPKLRGKQKFDQSPRPGSGRTITSQSSRPPSASYRRSMASTDVLGSPATVIHPPSAILQVNSGRPVLVTAPLRRHSTDVEERRSSLKRVSGHQQRHSTDAGEERRSSLTRASMQPQPHYSLPQRPSSNSSSISKRTPTYNLFAHSPPVREGQPRPSLRLQTDQGFGGRVEENFRRQQDGEK